MSAVVADTHTIVWYLLGSDRLSPTARNAMQGAIHSGLPVFVSVVTLIELTYLIERGRVDSQVRQRLIDTLGRSDSGVQLLPFEFDTAEALAQIPRDVVPDMPDRMIAATAAHAGLPLVTADARLRAANIATIW